MIIRNLPDIRRNLLKVVATTPRLSLLLVLSCLAEILFSTSAAAQETLPGAQPEPTHIESESSATRRETEEPSAAGQGLKPPTSTELVRRSARLPENSEFPGIRVGSFLAYPEISAAILHDNNIYGERREETSDYVTIFSPLIKLESDWNKHWLQLDAGADIDRYHDFPQESVEDYWLGADGRIDISEAVKLFGGARWAQDHEDRAEPDALSPLVAAEPTIYEQASADLGTLLRFGSVSLRLGGTFDNYNFHDVPSVLGPTINKDDRDRDMYSLGARVAFRTSQSVDIFAQYASDTREYKNVPDDFSFQRNSDGYRAAAGLRLRNARRTLVAELLAGQMMQKYDDPRFKDLSEPYFGVDLLWRPTPGISVTAFIDRALYESTIPDVSGYLDSAYGLRAERKLTKDLTVNGRFAYIRSEFQGSERLDTIIDAGAGLRYFVSRTVYLAADYRLIDRNSNEETSKFCCQYARDQVMFSVGVTPGRSGTHVLAQQPDAAALKIPGSNAFSGLYIGATVGYGSFHTVTEGGRGESGTDVGEMGDDGGTMGIFGGIGLTKDRWYIGFEAEVEASETEWDHSKSKDESRTAYVQKHGGYGAGVRLGRVMERGQLLFVRAMAVRSEFHSYYGQNDSTVVANAYNQTEEVSGLRLGLGIDIAAGNNLFIRLDYAYTDYESYDVSYLTTNGISTESFNNEENIARLGLGWQFGARKQETGTAPAEPISGFYAGAQVGPATLESRVDGVHRKGSSPEPSSFVGDFADQGWSPGAFIGYGIDINRWYLGAEIEANTSDTAWEHIRESPGGGGRDFSVDKKSDYGISLRLGYSFRNASLLYARVGAVRGRFNTAYEKGSSALFIDRTDTLSGTRAGFGTEVPISDVTFLRIDFTHTNYESYSFATGHGGGANADEMTFNNSENLFRLGLGFRF